MRLQHVDFRCSEDKVTETAVHALLQIEVIEGIDEVGPVEMRVDWNIWRNTVWQTSTNSGGKPLLFPTQSPGPASWDRDAFKVVGPAGIGVFEPGVLRPPDA